MQWLALVFALETGIMGETNSLKGDYVYLAPAPYAEVVVGLQVLEIATLRFATETIMYPSNEISEFFGAFTPQNTIYTAGLEIAYRNLTLSGEHWCRHNTDGAAYRIQGSGFKAYMRIESPSN